MKKIISTLAIVLSFVVFAPVVHAQDAGGYELKDPTRGFFFKAPSAMWSMNGSSYSVSMSHKTYYDARVSLKKSWYSVTTPSELYTKRVSSLKSTLPGAQMVKENEKVKVGGIDAVSFTYKDPGQQKIVRSILLVHKGKPYELEFTVKEPNFDKVKADFSSILTNIKTL